MRQNQIEYNFNDTYKKQIFKNAFYYIFSLVVFLFVSCSNDTNPESIVQITEGTEITGFSFLQSDNPSLNSDINLVINNNVISGKVPFGGDITNLIADFEHNGSEVVINNINQIKIKLKYASFAKKHISLSSRGCRKLSCSILLD